MPEKKQIGLGYLRAAFDPATINKETRTVEVVFATETPVVRMGWDGIFYEVLTCTKEAVMVDRLNSGAGPLLDTHNRYSVRNQLGAIEPNSVVIKDKECRCTVRFSKNPDVETVWNDVQDGIVRNISVGYNTYEITISEKEGQAPVYTATRWEPAEVSLVPVPADYNSAVRSANEQTHEVTIINHKKNNTMSTNNATRTTDIQAACRNAGLTDAFAQTLVDNADMDINGAREAIIAELVRAATPAATPPAAKPAAPDAAAEATTRTTGILAACRAANLTITYAEELVNGTLSLSDARAAIINKMAEGKPDVFAGTPAVRMGADERDKRRDGMVDGIISRIDPSAKGADGKIIQAGEFRGMSLLDMAREWLVGEGQNVRGLSKREVAKMALGLVRSGGYSTSDFPNILSNVFNKRLRKAYDLQMRTFTPWCVASTATDFKEMSRNQLGDLVFQEVKEGGEYKAEKLSETVEKYSVAKWGRIVNFSWESMVNDDLNAFSRIPQTLAAAAAQKQSDVVYGILSANAAMADTVALFHATHGNYTSTGTAISVASLGVGRGLMRKQKSIDSKNHLNLSPKFLIVGPDKEAEALQFTSQNYVAAQSGDINVWAGLMQPIVENRITGNKWYLAADPAIIDTIEYAFLDGEELYTEERTAFEKDGYEFKARMVFGAKAIDHRSLYYNTGA